MSIESELKTFLTSTNAPVSALIGTRYFAGVVKRNADTPNIVWNRIFTNRLQHLEGSSDLPTARFQLSCFDNDMLGAVALADAVRGAINDFSGPMGSVTVQFITLVDETDLYNPSPSNRQKRTYGRALDFEISYNEE